MNPARVRSRLITAACVVVVVFGWIYLAPTQIGGSASYVVTGGISMEPRFHTGDLAIVRPTAEYRVGDIVAYHSTLLHVVVLHRIIRLAGGHYTFKGDNNNFVDPVQPVRSQLVGKLWLHLPRGGVFLHWLHTPAIAALVVAAFGLFSLLGAGEVQRRRRRRRRRSTASGTQAPLPMKTADNPLRAAVDLTAFRTAAAVAALLFLGLGVIAFSRPVDKASQTRTRYTQKIHFAYQASAPAGAVYPTGIVATGDPIFVALVHRVRFMIDYRFSTAAPHQLRGTEQVFLTLTGPGGWSRSLPLGPLQRFGGPAMRTQVTVDLPSVQSLLNRVEKQTGVSGAGYTVAVSPQVHLQGEVAGQAIDTAFDPALSFQLSPLQLQPTSSSSPAGGSPSGGGSDPSQAGTVSAPTSTANSVRVLGHALSVAALRSVAVIGFLLCAALALVATVVKRVRPLDEAARIQAQYGQLIVPVVLGPDELGVAPVDVPTIAALARLAESGQRLILHSRNERRDTYLVNDEGTVYRYRADPGNVVWGEWSASAPRPLAHVAAATTRPAVASQLAFATSAAATPANGPQVVAAPLLDALGAAAKVFPPPPFLAGAPAQAPTEVRPAAQDTPAAPSPQPMPSEPLTARPRLRRWVASQSERARLVRDVGAAVFRTSER
jgi:signal peptidase I